MTVRILVVDNYDSFVFNLAQYLAQLGADVAVRRNDEVSADAVTDYDGVLLSPGPGTPADSGVCRQIVAEFGSRFPNGLAASGHDMDRRDLRALGKELEGPQVVPSALGSCR